ncbi:MAG TPA: 30S ribosomal protein S20 [Actinomycetota bacterium]
MANIKSQIKRNRQNEKRRQANKAVRTRLKTEAKAVRTAAEAGDAAQAQAALRTAARDIDRAASERVLHPRTAARRKSRLARAAARAAGSPSPETPVEA